MRPVILTRPREDAEETAQVLRESGFSPCLSPVMHIEPLDWAAPDWRACVGLVITSAHALPAFALPVVPRALPVFVVGARSFQGLRNMGYSRLYGPVLQSSELPPLVLSVLQGGRQGALLHLTSAEGGGDFYETLARASLPVKALLVYKSAAVPVMSAEAMAMLKQPCTGSVLFYSPRSASLFLAQVQQAGLVPALGRLHAFCISDAVLHTIAAAGFAALHVASRPTQESLLDCLAKHAPQGHSGN